MPPVTAGLTGLDTVWQVNPVYRHGRRIYRHRAQYINHRTRETENPNQTEIRTEFPWLRLQPVFRRISFCGELEVIPNVHFSSSLSISLYPPRPAPIPTKCVFFFV